MRETRGPGEFRGADALRALPQIRAFIEYAQAVVASVGCSNRASSGRRCGY
jgi:hypothetical protein